MFLVGSPRAVEDFLPGTATPTAVFTPTERRALAGYTWTRSRLVLNVLDDVRNRVEVVRPDEDGSWQATPFTDVPDVWSLDVAAVDADSCDDVWLVGNDFLTPESLYRVHVGGRDDDAELVRRAPERFDGRGLAISQHFATSAGGTRIRTSRSARPAAPPRPARPCSAATAASRSPACRRTHRPSVGPGWRAAAPTPWPTSAAASTARRGTRPACATSALGCSARKMAALLADLGKDVTYWENTEGGHGGAADAAQQATMQALLYTFLRQLLV